MKVPSVDEWKDPAVNVDLEESPRIVKIVGIGLHYNDGQAAAESSSARYWTGD
jgi:hypothetical protein